MLQKETKLGLNYGQILATLTLIGGLMTLWVQINSRLTAAEREIETLKIMRNEDQVKWETNRMENREDHQSIMIKLDNLLLQNNKK